MRACIIRTTRKRGLPGITGIDCGDRIIPIRLQFDCVVIVVYTFFRFYSVFDVIVRREKSARSRAGNSCR